MGNSGKNRTHNPITSRQYRVNLLLFLAFTILSMIWFHRHLYAYVNQSLFIGGSLTLWGLVKAAQSVLKLGIREETKPTAARILGSSTSTEYLIAGIVIAIILLFMTSSIYFTYEGAPSGESDFEVEVLHNGNPYIPKVSLKSYDRVSGRPYFFRLNSLDLTFRITTPRGYQEVEETFRPCRSLRLSIPGDEFEQKKFHIARLIPGSSLLHTLPSNPDKIQTKYYLRISKSGEKPIKIENLIRQNVYVGAKSDEDFEWIIEREKAEVERGFLIDYLVGLGAPEERATAFVRTWNDHETASGFELAAGDEISIELWHIDPNTGDHDKIGEWQETVEEKLITDMFLEVD